MLLLIAQVLDVNVGAKSWIIRQVIPGVIRIFVDHDLIAVPEPSVGITDFVGRDAPVEIVEPEAAGPPAVKTEHVAWTESTTEPAMFPWMIHMQVGIVGTLIVTYPLVVGMDVRSFRMPSLIRRNRRSSPLLRSRALLRGPIRLRRGTLRRSMRGLRWSWTVRWDMSVAHITGATSAGRGLAALLLASLRERANGNGYN